MKKFFISILCAFTAFAAVSCVEEVQNSENSEVGVVKTVQFSAGPVTKTVFGTPSGNKVSTLWTENETVGISLNLNAAKQSSAPVVASGGATATFNADIDDNGSAPYTFYAISPFSSIISISSDYKNVQVDIPASQTPLAYSVDEKAQIVVAKYEAGNTFPTSRVNLDFSHVTAYGKISFSNLALANDENIVSVSLTAAENWVGRYYYYLEDLSSNSEGDLVANSVGKTITLTTSSASDIWFACAPVDLGGKNVKVVVSTDKSKTYTKNITIPAGKTFASGKVNAFTINMSGISADVAAEYALVTDPSELTVGSQVIIAAPGDVATAMSTTQNSNNRGSASVTKENNVITSPSDAVQIFTIANGNQSNTVAFYTGAGYIYAASSGSNWLRTEETLSDNSSWVVTIAEGVATLTAQGTNTRNVVRFNSGNNPPIFSCYASTSTTGSLVSIYKFSLPDTREESGLAWDNPVGLGDIKNQELALPTLTNPNSLTVTYSSSDPTVATVENDTHSVTLLKEGTTEIHAVFAGNDDYKPADVHYTLTVEDTRTAVTLSFETASYPLTVGSNDYNNFEGQTVTASPSVAVTYELTGATVGTVDPSTGVVTLDGNTVGTATITASFAGNATHKAAENASYTIVVSPANLTEGDPWSYTFTSNPWGSTSGTTALEGLDWTISSGYAAYNSGYLALSTTNNKSDATLSTSDYSDGINRIVVEAKTNNTCTVNLAVTVGGESLGSAITLTNAPNLTPYTFESEYLLAGEVVISFTGPTGGYQIKSISINPAPKYAITVDNGIANGSVSADLAEAAEGATVTLTATPSSGYALSAWNVYKTGNPSTTVDVTENAFTMPAYAVTVSASFAAVPTISMNITSIDDVAAAGVTSAVASAAYNLLNGASNNDVVITCDGTVVTSAEKHTSAGSIVYTVAANTEGARDGWIKVKYGTEDPHQITVNQLSGSNTPQEYEITSGTFSGNSSSISLTVSGVTITQLKDDGTNVNTTYNTVSTLRVYRANQMQFTGKTFTKIEMYYSSSYSGVDWTVVSGGGTVTIDTNNKKVVWENANGASTVALKNSTASGTNTQLRTTKFVVTY